MKAKIALVPPLLVALAGCNTGASSSPSLDMMAQSAAPSAITHAAPPRVAPVDSALARLPEGAGAIRVVRERYYPNGYGQDIVLDGDAPLAAANPSNGASRIAVSIQSGPALASSEKAPVWKPGEAGIKNELSREFPGLSMRVVVNAGYENRYGRFGVAVGRDGDLLRCVYAWQYVDDARRSFGHGARIPTTGAEAAPAAVRIKLCRADATVDELVAYVKGLTIDIPETYASAPPVALRIAPARAPRLRAVARQRPAVARRPARPAQEAPYQEPAYSAYPAAQPMAPYAPTVMAPQAAVQVMPATQPVYAGAVPAAPAAAGAPRYLAPVPQTGAGAGAAGLNPSLPPQAYRGPTTRGGTGNSRPAMQNPYRRDGARAYDGSPVGAIAAEGAPRILPLAAGEN